MIGLDTNVLARYYVQTQNDDIKTQKQKQIAKQLLDHSPSLFIANTVIIEFEWILRAICKFSVDDIILVYEHLLSLPNVFFENKTMIEKAIIFAKAGIEFTDAFHLASYQHCNVMYSFDNKGFAKKVEKYQFLPTVIVPSE
ncbi:Uncharacterised protein [Moraxella lacunata]|uniref:Uncharacterized protein n=1 Tax=Moraxella lacunata TaxID=477 RepID=A0A378TUS5_MORLA|nr:type II toxin-antitoxin system VapC family toxin [Moraxella lacunata]STZ63632.1 Uncharacterised protein [Moraxella lacunata]